MTDHDHDRSKDEGQQGLDRETEQRNRENETGQQGGKSPGNPEGSSSAFGQQGQSAGGDTSQQDQSGQAGQQSGSGFVGSQADKSGDYLTKGENDQDFASEGQGAQDNDAGTADIETGQQRQQRPDSELDDGSSDSDR